MGLLKKKKTLRTRSVGTGGGSTLESDLRPYFVEKRPPCTSNCPNHNPIRRALMNISKGEDYEKSSDQALTESWHMWMEKNPFPSVCGRVCPHPCETDCNRTKLEGAVSINAFERFLGDYGLKNKLVPKKVTEETRSEKIAVIGSGPAGMTAAYHLARRGYPVTVFEAFPKAGGMLRYGIPDYRLPIDILDAEIDRICDMGVELKLNTMIGNDVKYTDLQKDYKAIFVGLGAHKGYLLRVEGEDAKNVFTGTDFLHRANNGETIDVGDHVVVIGGGDTAVDAARVSRRLGAEVTILYRRTREEMPAIDPEIDGAIEEGIKIHYLAAPIEINKDGDKAVGMKCQRMELGEPDASGRRRPVPIEGDTFDLEMSTLIAAISQAPDFTGFEDFIEGRDWIKVDDKFKTKIDGVYSGGDNVNLDIAVTAIAHGRFAAESIHEMITGEATVDPADGQKLITSEGMAMAYYEAKDRVKIGEMAPDERLKTMDAEIVTTLTVEEATAESKRCLSCGRCFDCGTCWSYCGDNAIVKPLVKGDPYTAKMEFCKGCKKCGEACPCGFIDLR
ncbi:MAG: FAD-dependent oxidoreductase [candidate division Zixibacteria bacterium]|nr:FAD-dependent oxidoreductase [candidate division Zixibacteria bacterium]